MTFTTDWKVHVAGQDWDHPVTTKDLLEIDVQADGLNVQSVIDFEVSADGQPLVPFGTANLSPQSAVVGATDFFGRRIGVCIDASSNSSTMPIALRAVTLRSQIRPAIRRIRTYDVLLGEGNVDRFGGRHIGRAFTDYQQLEPLQWGGRVKLRDEFGEGWDVLVLPPINRRTVYLRGESGKGTGDPVVVASLTLKLLGQDPPVPVMYPTNYWDDGFSLWDLNAYWSAP